MSKEDGGQHHLPWIITSVNKVTGLQQLPHGRLGGEEIRSCVTWCHKWWNEMTPKPCSDYQIPFAPAPKQRRPRRISQSIGELGSHPNNKTHRPGLTELLTQSSASIHQCPLKPKTLLPGGSERGAGLQQQLRAPSCRGPPAPQPNVGLCRVTTGPPGGSLGQTSAPGHSDTLSPKPAGLAAAPGLCPAGFPGSQGPAQRPGRTLPTGGLSILTVSVRPRALRVFSLCNAPWCSMVETQVGACRFLTTQQWGLGSPSILTLAPALSAQGCPLGTSDKGRE
ncbi:uncharacterized protein [Bos mutus]|uniref:uncharacterized protein isoform X2 n=1 Tax=Bos mutus TaxID=72004 RepID=UPI0038B62744